ncbi:MAG: hypothetical protein LC808_37710, partial [Actinobacteria bacterium]|nr:hypothetical protein [Actinomycetota bacterium]
LLDRRAGHQLDHVSRKAGKGTWATGAHPHNAIPGRCHRLALGVLARDRGGVHPLVEKSTGSR